jgi:hypothetical protein
MPCTTVVVVEEGTTVMRPQVVWLSATIGGWGGHYCREAPGYENVRYHRWLRRALLSWGPRLCDCPLPQVVEEGTTVVRPQVVWLSATTGGWGGHYCREAPGCVTVHYHRWLRRALLSWGPRLCDRYHRWLRRVHQELYSRYLALIPKEKEFGVLLLFLFVAVILFLLRFVQILTDKTWFYCKKMLALCNVWKNSQKQNTCNINSNYLVKFIRGRHIPYWKSIIMNYGLLPFRP